jgi:ATP-dependent protease ClpP protease subunit
MAGRNWYTIKAEGAGPAIVYLYGTVGQDWWGDGNSALQFAQDLDALAPRDIELRVNSEGGDVFEGYAIYSALNRYPGRVTAYVDGLAASAASFLIMAANEVVMGQASFLMIHNAWTITWGNASELREIAERLDAIDGQIVDIYDRHCDKDADEIRAAMGATTWLTAEEAVEWGFASRIDEGLNAAASVSREAARLFAAIPEAVKVLDCEPSDASSTMSDDVPEEPTTEADVTGQESEAEAEPQEQLAARVVALKGRTQRTFNRKDPS